ncbi:alpha-ketoacid dehydrogenase subunit beta [Effusibacillus dendaii]|uniref:Pyruvate dehydrogenase E1 component subunit beta n=1 Tax=Effusibacillus dendaii TaxID=2743772 RepID=A0A7I8D4U4_9BACL|nr:alpha-ketoacid dehydrogenase subunit beta [Effusibacillus dendaii]BCJ85095.1 pyruvate dehydrogenase E1 component subunit beta [Effusibacillus dendaii]
MAQMTMIQAITDAMRVELKRDDNVLVFGEDVGKNGGVFRATDGLQKEFGENRVFDTPLAESGIGGLAVGLSLQGFRPVAEIQFFGFVFEVFDEIAAQAARMRFRSGGHYNCPIVIRSPFGGGVKTPELHADSLEGLMAQTPGVKVVIPSNPYDAKGLLISAIRDNDPVIFLEHMKLYRSFRGEVPEGEYTVPIGKANVVQDGTDLTIVTYGAMVQTSLKAAEEAKKARGANVEVIDLRTVSPIDIDTILQSIQKTKRAVVVQEAPRNSGVASEVMAQIMERGVLHLEAPVLRVTSPETPYPFAMAEDEWLPDPARVLKAINEVLDF